MKRPSIILVIATSIDGRIALPEGGAADLGSNKDKALLNEALSKVDATIFGSGTLKAHKSTYLVKDYSNKGHIKKKFDQPISIVVGNYMKFSTDWSYFKQPIRRWLISSYNLNNDIRPKGFEKKIDFTNSWKETLFELKKNHGINKIALLGGAKLIHSFIHEDLIDEIKITIVPKIVGGQYTWISNKDKKIIPNSSKKWIIKLVKKLTTNEIFIHYQSEFGE